MYSAVLLDEKSQLALSAWADKNIKINGVRLPIVVRDNGWKMICHHMTIKFGGTPEFVKQYLGTEQNLEITHYGMSDKAVAVRVVGFHSENKIPHITVAVNVKNGGKPVDSNKITEWLTVEKGPTLKGVVTELQ
jgi:hypothetical protein